MTGRPPRKIVAVEFEAASSIPIMVIFVPPQYLYTCLSQYAYIVKALGDYLVYFNILTELCLAIN